MALAVVDFCELALTIFKLQSSKPEFLEVESFPVLFGSQEKSVRGFLRTAAKAQLPTRELSGMLDNFSLSSQFHNASHAPDAYRDAPSVSLSPTADGSSTINVSESDDVLPSTHACRTLVLCFDGTGDQFDGDNSNVVQFFSMLKKDDPRQQMAYYQAGIGTYTIPQIATPFYAKLSKTLDMMLGHHLDAHVMGMSPSLHTLLAVVLNRHFHSRLRVLDAKLRVFSYISTPDADINDRYVNPADEAGDKICLFGFSRGAYTARALAGMLHKVGLLPPYNYQQVPFAYHMYSRDDPDGWKQSRVFKKAFSIDVDVEFVGVWDTVNSVGIIPRRLPFTKANNQIRFFRQALALDERRTRFMPSFCNRSTQTDNELGVQKGEMPRSIKKCSTCHIPCDQSLHDESSSNGHHHESSPHDAAECLCTQPVKQTNVEEVWFAGCHCDVGGGAVKNGARNSLARIPLRWMIREIFKADVGILFYRSMFRHVGMDPSKLLSPRPPIIFNSPIKAGYVRLCRDHDEAVQCNPNGELVSEELEDLYDACSDIHDQLSDMPYWWILEVLPQVLYYQREEDDEWAKKIIVNMGEGRRVPKRGQPKVHRTVKIRMEAKGLKEGKYEPKAKIVEPTWVD
ncbi:hypothetical protein EDD17DRAFT_1759354 [Pisolithus thermaeus]|nr:hypothetical protein EDD17DRAFT_1759354 [Pisolithus thermaeus]